MEFLRFLRNESPETAGYILMMSVLYGIAAGLFVPLVLWAAIDIVKGKNYIIYLFVLPGIIFLQIITYRIAQSRTAALVEEAAEKWILRIANTIRHDELSVFEQRNRSELYLILTNTQVITDAAVQSITLLQNLITLSVLWVYIFLISKIAGTLFLLLFGLIMLLQEAYQKIGRGMFAQVAKTENRLFTVFNHFLDGFKEIKIYEEKNHDLFSNYLKPLIRNIQILRRELVFFYTEFGRSLVMPIYIFIGIELFFLPSKGVIKLVIITLYLIKPATIILTSLPRIARGKAALARIRQFGKDSCAPDKMLYEPAREVFHTFDTLLLQDICFTYHEADATPGFSVGPISLTINAGDLIFFAGGNGSGKSTLIKLLTGLYSQKSGTIRINGTRAALKEHRYLFSAIFSDFHLFESLYGIESPDETQIAQLLTQMKLEGKSDYVKGRFTTLDLSTGQRKRLALIMTLMEDKPIYVFDEWAADQDPQFRRYFYEELLPFLKKEGKTILVVTHDDRFYHIADRVITLKDGKIADDSESDQKTVLDTKKEKPLLPFKRIPDTKEFQGSALDEDYSEQPPITDFRQFLPLLKKIGWLALLNGLNTIAMIHIIFAVMNLSPGESRIRLFILFTITLLLERTLSRRFAHVVVQTIEKFIANTRLRIIDQIRKIDLASFESLGVGQIHTILTADLRALSDVSLTIAMMLKLMIRMVSLLLYFAWVSVPVFLVEMMVIGGIGIFYVYNQVRIRAAIEALRNGEAVFFDAIKHLLDGFKELRLNDRKSDAFFNSYFCKLLSDLRSLRKVASGYLMTNVTIVYGVWTALLGLLPLILPVFDISSANIFRCIAILFFLPINPLIQAVPPVLMALTSLKRLSDMEQILNKLEQDTVAGIPTKAQDIFNDLSYKDISFCYNEKDVYRFSVGPVSLNLQAGEILFITGGNGSGKSTLLKLITGLYKPKKGEVLLNGQVMDIQQHRYLFSVIFSDFHLFDRLYGISDIDQEQVNKMLALMEIDKKVRFEDGKFSTLDLSTGQKKRLAMVAAIMDQRPIFIFDEWAAEQDPYFRHYFYESLLPAFKAQGKAVIAVTHHDHYFHTADRILKMEYGQFKR